MMVVKQSTNQVITVFLLPLLLLLLTTVDVSMATMLFDTRERDVVTMSTTSGDEAMVCPGPCDCYNMAETVDCSQRQLLQVNNMSGRGSYNNWAELHATVIIFL